MNKKELEAKIIELEKKIERVENFLTNQSGDFIAYDKNDVYVDK